MCKFINNKLYLFMMGCQEYTRILENQPRKHEGKQKTNIFNILEFRVFLNLVFSW